MSRSEIEISKRCSSCGASLRDGAGFCRECGADLKKDEAAPLSKLEEENRIDGLKTTEMSLPETKNKIEDKETQQTMPLDSKTDVLEVDERDLSETALTTDLKSADAARVWANFEQEEDDGDKEDWSETSPTVALDAKTIPLIEQQEEEEPDSFADEEEKELENQTVSASSEIVDDNEPELSAKAEPRVFVERTRRSRSKVKRMVVKSQRALDKASPDPSIRFAIITLVVFLLTLVIFFLNKSLR